VRVLSLARVLFVLLAFQLAVGLQIGVAHATTPVPAVSKAVMPAHASGTDGDDCPMHDSSLHIASLHSAPHAKAPQNTSTDKHDCCKSSGCQCQCGNVPLAFNVSLIRNSPASALVQPVRVERIVVAPADTHFRPPIAS
jgi:hypothetical protein